MKRTIRLYLAVVALTLAVVCLPTAPRVSWAADSAKASPDDFDREFPKWKKMLADLRQLQAKYQNARPEDRAPLAAEYKALLAEGEAMLPALTVSAEAAYAADPTKYFAAGGFLLGRVLDHATMDNSDEALRLAKILIDHDYKEKNKNDSALLYHAAAAAFNVNDHKLAKSYLKSLAKLGPLEDPAKKLASDLEKYGPYWEEEQKIRTLEAKADDLPRVKFETSQGTVVIELFENEAPNTVANFINLVEKKFYDGLTFHRVITGFMAQGGDPKGTGSGGPGYSIPCECYSTNYRKHFRGSLSMAHAGRDTGGSQFFITFVPTDHLNGKHTVFGRVIEGMDAVAKFKRVEPGARGEKSEASDRILTATVLRKRNHKYEPTKLKEK